MVLMIIPNVYSIQQEIRINQTLYIDVYTNGTEFIRNAELRIPEDTFPKGPLSINDVCTATETKTFDFSYELDAEIECNISSVQWDLGQNISMILNNTQRILGYSQKQMEDCESAINYNIGLQKELEICNNKTAVLNTYSSLQSAYDVCAETSKKMDDEFTICKSDLKVSEGQKFNYFIYGLIAAGIFVFATKPKPFQSPAGKQFGRN